jgi:hypothetical protein
MPTNRPEYKVGDYIRASVSNQIVEAQITTIVERTDGLRLQVSFLKDRTALIHEWQIVKE